MLKKNLEISLIFLKFYVLKIIYLYMWEVHYLIKIIAHLLFRDDRICSTTSAKWCCTCNIHTYISINKDLSRETASSKAVLRRASCHPYHNSILINPRMFLCFPLFPTYYIVNRVFTLITKCNPALRFVHYEILRFLCLIKEQKL